MSATANYSQMMLRVVRFSGMIAAILLGFFVVLPGSRTFADDPTPTIAPTLEPTFSSVPVTVNISGRTSSGTAGVPIPAGLPITLQIAHLDPKTGAPSEAVKRDVPLGADGSFTFDKVLATPGDIAIISTTFQDVLQVSPPVRIQNSQDKIDVGLTLYAVTNDPSVVTLVRVQHILDFKGNVMQVLGTYDYKNNSDRLYLSTTKSTTGQPTSVNIPLPVGARAVAFSSQTSLRYSIGGDVNAPIVYDSKPVQPGQVHEVILSYQLPYANGTPIDQDYPFATASLQVLIPDDSQVALTGLRIGTTLVAADQLEKAANTAINATRTYSEYTLKTPLKAGDRVVYMLGRGTVAPAAQAATAGRASGITGVEIVGILIFLAILAIVGVVIARRTTGSRKRA